MKVITATSCWFSTVIRVRTMPRSGLLRDGITATTSVSHRSTSPGKTGVSQRSSSIPAAPRLPPTSPSAPMLATIIAIVIAVLCQPLAAIRPKCVCAAAASDRWKGCGS